MAQLEIVDARRDVGAVAGVETDLLVRDSAQGVIDHLHPQRHDLAAFLDAELRVPVIVGRQSGIVDLQHEAGVDDGLILDVHSVGKREEVFLLGRVEVVAVVQRHVRG